MELPKDCRDKPRNPTRSQKKPGNENGTECQQTREIIPGILPGTRRNQEMKMEQNARKRGRPSPEPCPELKGTRKGLFGEKTVPMKSMTFLCSHRVPYASRTCTGGTTGSGAGSTDTGGTGLGGSGAEMNQSKNGWCLEQK